MLNEDTNGWDLFWAAVGLLLLVTVLSSDWGEDRDSPLTVDERFLGEGDCRVIVPNDREVLETLKDMGIKDWLDQCQRQQNAEACDPQEGMCT